MKLEKTKSLVGLVILLIGVQVQAATLDFTFSFQNGVVGNGAITGIVRGLTDNATGAATSVEVLTHTAGFGIGEYIGNPDFNTWTVSNGMITDVSFEAYGTSNTAPAVTLADLGLFSAVVRRVPVFLGVLDPVAGGPPLSASTDAQIVFTPVAPVPVPAALPLLVSALVGLRLISRERRIVAG